MSFGLHIPNLRANVTVTWNGNGLQNPAQSNFGITNDSDADVATIGAALTPILDALWTSAQWSSAVTLSKFRVKKGPNETGAFGEFSVEQAGTGAGGAVASNFSVLAKKATNVGGRKGRGRMFLPGIDEELTDTGGELIASSVTAIQTLLTTFLNALATAGYNMHLLHNDHFVGEPGQNDPPILNPTPLNTYLVTALTCDPVGATQRRRLRR